MDKQITVVEATTPATLGEVVLALVDAMVSGRLTVETPVYSLLNANGTQMQVPMSLAVVKGVHDEVTVIFSSGIEAHHTGEQLVLDADETEAEREQTEIRADMKALREAGWGVDVCYDPTTSGTLMHEWQPDIIFVYDNLRRAVTLTELEKYSSREYVAGLRRTIMEGNPALPKLRVRHCIEPSDLDAWNAVLIAGMDNFIGDCQRISIYRAFLVRLTRGDERAEAYDSTIAGAVREAMSEVEVSRG